MTEQCSSAGENSDTKQEPETSPNDYKSSSMLSDESSSDSTSMKFSSKPLLSLGLGNKVNDLKGLIRQAVTKIGTVSTSSENSERETPEPSSPAAVAEEEKTPASDQEGEGEGIK